MRTKFSLNGPGTQNTTWTRQSSYILIQFWAQMKTKKHFRKLIDELNLRIFLKSILFLNKNRKVQEMREEADPFALPRPLLLLSWLTDLKKKKKKTVLSFRKKIFICILIIPFIFFTQIRQLKNSLLKIIDRKSCLIG